MTNRELKLREQEVLVTELVMSSAARRLTSSAAWVLIHSNPTYRKAFASQGDVSKAMKRCYSKAAPTLGRDKRRTGDQGGAGVVFAYTALERTAPAVKPPRTARTFDSRVSLIPRVSQPRPVALGGPQVTASEPPADVFQVTIRGSLKGRKIVIMDVGDET